MTTVTIRKAVNRKYAGFTCMGHAEYAKRSQPDILCASVSMLVINTINCMEELCGEKMDVKQNEETGFIRCDFRDSLSEASLVLMDAMVYGLQNLEKTYGKKFIQVKFMEE